MPGWSIQQIPPLNQDGSNCEIWRAVVRAVASQHNALVMLEREPFPDNQVEIEAAWQLKEFLMQVCGPVFKAALIPLSPYRGWEYWFSFSIYCRIQYFSRYAVPIESFAICAAGPGRIS